MTEYCTVTFPSWEPESEPNPIIEYVFDNAQTEVHERPHLRDHLSWSSSPRLQVTKKDDDDKAEDNEHCVLMLQCKPIYGVAIAGVAVASEARTVEVYDARDGSYLQTVRGRKDTEDSEADDNIVHFMCHCTLTEPLFGLRVKFLSLGQRKSFEMARIRVVLETCSSQNAGNAALSSQTIDMDRLRRDVDDMGDSVSDRAKSFLTTLENFQRSKQGTFDDMHHLLLDKSLPGSEGRSLAGITTLLSMFTASGMGSGPSPLGTSTHSTDATQAEGSMVNNLLSQMMSSLAVQQEAGTGKESGDDMYQFLQSVCGQVSQFRAADQTPTDKDGSKQEGMEETGATGESGAMDSTSAELESRVTAQVEAMVESRLSAVEQHIKEEVDQRMQEMETRMTGKLDAIFALLQNSQKQS